MIERFKVTGLALNAAKKLLLAQLRGAGDEGDDDGAEPVDDAVVYSQIGVAVRPVVGVALRALGLQDGDDVLVLKLWDRTRTPTDLESGETRVYAAGAVSVALRLLTSQAVLEAATVLLGAGATKGVARSGDPVSVTIPSGTALTGTVGMTPATFTLGAPLTVTGTITAGSSTVRAKD